MIFPSTILSFPQVLRLIHDRDGRIAGAVCRDEVTGETYEVTQELVSKLLLLLAFETLTMNCLNEDV